MYRKYGMPRSHGCERVANVQEVRSVFCSRQKLSTCIHAGNATITRPLLGILAFTALVLP